MIWEVIGAVGQAVSALALVLVLVQVRNARAEAARAVEANRTERVRDGALRIMSDERLRAALRKANENLGRARNPGQTALMERAGLNEDEAAILSQWCFALLVLQSESIENASILTEAQREWSDARIRNVYAPGTVNAVWYSAVRGGLSPRTVRYIDDVIARPGRES